MHRGQQRCALTRELLEMGFEEPEVLVEFASHGGEEIRGDGIAQVVGLLNSSAQSVDVMSEVVNQPLQLLGAIRSGEVGFLQPALGGDFAGGAVGDASECRDPL